MSKVDVFMPTHEKRTFSVSQLNTVELARTLSWRENALFEEREKNNQLVHLSTCLLVNLSTHHTLSTFQQEIQHYECPFYQPITHLAAKNRFSRRFVLMQKGVGLWIR